MRESCLDCCRKHLSSALVLALEAEQGYPMHAWIAVGHLNEAADETISEYPSLANRIREERLEFMISINRSIRINEDTQEFILSSRLYQVPFLDLIKDVTAQHLESVKELKK
jgi:hypothetical protein